MKILSTLHSAFVASSAVRTPSHSAFVASSAVRTSSPSQSTFNLATRRVGVEALRMSTSGTEFSPDDLGKKYPELLVFDMDACLWNKVSFIVEMGFICGLLACPFDIYLLMLAWSLHVLVSMRTCLKKNPRSMLSLTLSFVITFFSILMPCMWGKGNV